MELDNGMKFLTVSQVNEYVKMLMDSNPILKKNDLLRQLCLSFFLFFFDLNFLHELFVHIAHLIHLFKSALPYYYIILE